MISRFVYKSSQERKHICQKKSEFDGHKTLLIDIFDIEFWDNKRNPICDFCAYHVKW
jgi:hypothetical protein